MQSARQPSSNTLCQVGLTNTASFTTLLNNYGSTFVTNYLAVSTSKSASSAMTCESLTSIGSPAIGSVTAAQLATITTADFPNCVTLLGASANEWSSAQLALLVAVANTVEIFF